MVRIRYDSDSSVGPSPATSQARRIPPERLLVGVGRKTSSSVELSQVDVKKQQQQKQRLQQHHSDARLDLAGSSSSSESALSSSSGLSAEQPPLPIESSDDDLPLPTAPETDRKVPKSAVRQPKKDSGDTNRDESAAESFAQPGDNAAYADVNLRQLEWRLCLAVQHSVSQRSATVVSELQPRHFDEIDSHKISQKSVSKAIQSAEYAPAVFAHIRLLMCGIDDSAFAKSWATPREKSGSAGRSGATFIFSGDRRFVAKTISADEAKTIVKFLSPFVGHLRDNPTSLLNRMLALYKLESTHVLILTNCLPVDELPSSNAKLRVYDLKGATLGRTSLAKEAVSKDTNFLAATKGHHVHEHCPAKPGKLAKLIERGDAEPLCMLLRPEERAQIIGALEKDVSFLRSQGLMDYSLLVGVGNGVSYLISGESPAPAPLSRSDTRRRSVVFIERKDSSKGKLLNDDSRVAEDRLALAEASRDWKGSLFQRDGVLRVQPLPCTCDPLFDDCRDETLQVLDNRTVFLSIIDYTQRWNGKKKLARAFKSARFINRRDELSTVSPNIFASRFLDFMGSYVLTSPHHHPTDSAVLERSRTSRDENSDTEETVDIETADVDDIDPFSRSFTRDIPPMGHADDLTDGGSSVTEQLVFGQPVKPDEAEEPRRRGFFSLRGKRAGRRIRASLRSLTSYSFEAKGTTRPEAAGDKGKVVVAAASVGESKSADTPQSNRPIKVRRVAGQLPIAVCVSAHRKQVDGDLELRVGDMVELLHVPNSNPRWKGRLANGMLGTFDASAVEVHDESDSSSDDEPVIVAGSGAPNELVASAPVEGAALPATTQRRAYIQSIPSSLEESSASSVQITPLAERRRPPSPLKRKSDIEGNGESDLELHLEEATVTTLDDSTIADLTRPRPDDLPEVLALRLALATEMSKSEELRRQLAAKDDKEQRLLGSLLQMKQRCTKLEREKVEQTLALLESL